MSARERARQRAQWSDFDAREAARERRIYVVGWCLCALGVGLVCFAVHAKIQGWL